MEKYILSIDQGTSSTRCLIFNQSGKLLGANQREHRQIYPNPSWVEHDPNEIKASVLQTIKSSLQEAKLSISDISAIGVTNQRETIVAWDKDTGIPLFNAIVWQCRRTVDIIDELKAEGYESLFKAKTGLVLDAYFSGTKIKWLIDNVDKIADKIRDESVQFGTIDAWIIKFLTDKHNTDASNASRTLLFDINKMQWDDELLEILKIPQSTLPEVVSNGQSDGFGYLNEAGNSVPIAGVLGDQQAALFGQSGFAVGDLKTTYGTGNFMLLNTGSKIIQSQNGLLSTVGWELDKTATYALEGSVFVTGAALRWLRDELNVISDYNEIDGLVSGVDTNPEVYFVPAFVGLGAPHWDSTARGMLIGLTAATTKSHILSSALDAIVFQTEDLLNLMKQETSLEIKSMKVDGGITKSQIVMQRQSDISQLTINIPRNTETTALGAAMIAGLGSIFENLEDISQFNPIVHSFHPKIKPDEAKVRYFQWNRAVTRSLKWLGE